MLKEITAQDAARMLKKHGIRPSTPRVLIYHYIYNHPEHPRAEHIFSILKQDNPTLSLTTVYNTLKLLVDNHMLQAVPIEGNEMRYDANTAFHGHFKCRSCLKVFDFKAPVREKTLLPEGLFQVEQVNLDCYGICPDCSIENA